MTAHYDILTAFLHRWLGRADVRIVPRGALFMGGAFWSNPSELGLEEDSPEGEIRQIIHEVMHFLVATPDERSQMNWGLGFGPPEGCEPEEYIGATREGQIATLSDELRAIGLDIWPNGRWARVPVQGVPVDTLAADIKTTWPEVFAP